MTRNDLTAIRPELLHLCRADGAVATAPPPGICIYHRDTTSPKESYLYDPVLCVVLQGAKTMRSGGVEVKVSAGDALVVSHHLPVISRITKADPESPYLAIVLSLSLASIRELFAQTGDVPIHKNGSGAISCHPYDPEWLEPLHRYLLLSNDTQALEVLGPALLREIHYRLLMSPTGAILQSLMLRDSHSSRIARAIALIRNDIAAPLRVASLAKEVGMSASAFHGHFKTVTGTTPLQYQKDLRLITSRSLLESGEHSVSSTAFEVGYESPTHFSRDFKRKFGQNPSSNLQ